MQFVIQCSSADMPIAHYSSFYSTTYAGLINDLHNYPQKHAVNQCLCNMYLASLDL